MLGIYSFISRIFFPQTVYKNNYAIGILVGKAPTGFQPQDSRQYINNKNPVLTAQDVSDVPAVFVADPFMIREESRMYMFFEVLNAKSKKGEIGLACSDDGIIWKYDQIVLSERFHLSYPYIFKYENDYYMIPETGKAEEVRLYKADDFPRKWSFAKTLLKGRYLDTSVFYYTQKWWLFTAIGDDSLYLFFADDLMGPWQLHPKSPIVEADPHIARPGGRVIVLGDQVIRYAQDDFPKYGLKIHAFQVTALSTETYEEEMVVDSLLGPSGNGWNTRGMHHIDPHQISENHWIACVDGWSTKVKAFLK